MGEEGDPEEDIREFYDWVSEQTGDEKAGVPSLIPVREYLITNSENGDVTIYNPDGTPVDPDDIPPNWQDLIVKDKDGNPITDASQLGLHIKPIGKNKYEIASGIVPYLKHDGYFYSIDYYQGTPGKMVKTDKPDEHTDRTINTKDGNLEITTGFFVLNNKIYALFIGDKEALDKGIGIQSMKDDYSISLRQFTKIPVFSDLYLCTFEMTKEGQNSATIYNPWPENDLTKAIEENGNFNFFHLKKEKL